MIDWSWDCTCLCKMSSSPFQVCTKLGKAQKNDHDTHAAMFRKELNAHLLWFGGFKEVLSPEVRGNLSTNPFNVGMSTPTPTPPPAACCNGKWRLASIKGWVPPNSLALDTLSKICCLANADFHQGLSELQLLNPTSFPQKELWPSN